MAVAVNGAPQSPHVPGLYLARHRLPEAASLGEGQTGGSGVHEPDELAPPAGGRPLPGSQRGDAGRRAVRHRPAPSPRTVRHSPAPTPRRDRRHRDNTQAAARVGVLPVTLRRAALVGNLEARRSGKVWLTTEAHARAWLRAARHRPGPKPGEGRGRPRPRAAPPDAGTA